MKANELMIGDWVRVPRLNKNGKVYRIDRANGYGNGFVAVLRGDFHEGDIEPVLLTPEILEKNGFECRGAWCLPGEDLGLRQDGDSWGLLSYYAEYNALAFCHIEYVHQLQHVLRLCGIEEEIKL